MRNRPETALEFDPEGTDAIPRLFDEFDRIAAATAGREVRGELPSGHENIFRFSLLDANADIQAAAGAFRPPFGHLALLAQIPGVDAAAKAGAEKGVPLTAAETTELETRLAAVRRWLEAYAPEKALLTIHRDAIPAEAAALTPAQRAFLAALAVAAPAGSAETPANGDAWQTAIFAVAADHGLDAKAAFNALYLAFIGRASGPRAGWLLAGLDHGFVVDRLRAAGVPAA